MCASRLTTVGVVVSSVALFAAYRRSGELLVYVPEQYRVGVLAVGFVLVGFFWVGVEAYRWRRTAHALGLEYVGMEPPEDASVTTLESYQGEVDGRLITVGCSSGAATSRRRTRTYVETPVDAPVHETIHVRHVDRGGKPESELPEKVPVSIRGIEAEFDVYSPDAALARDVLRTPSVREAITEAERLEELWVVDGYARTVTRGRVFDAAVVEQHVAVVRETAGAIESLANAP